MKLTQLIAITLVAAIGGAAIADMPQGQRLLPGMGPGMMRGMMGPGMMGGMMGPGMMGGMMGPGMMNGMMGGALQWLDLNESQRAQIAKTQEALRRKNWDLMGSMHNEQARLRGLYLSENRDRAAILAAYSQLFELRKQRVAATLDAQEEIDGVLTKDQRAQLRRWGGGWRMGAGR